MTRILTISRTWRLAAVAAFGIVITMTPGPVPSADDLDRQLLESLEGGERARPQSPAVAAGRLLENLDSARKRLAAGDLGEPTRSIQQQILDDIDALLAQSGSPPPDGPPPSAGEQSQQGSGGEQSGTAQAQAGQDAGEQGGTERNGEPLMDPGAASKESTERTTRGIETAAERERRLGLATSAWGHLPPKEREQMRSAFSETYLPEYDELVRRYYEALAARRNQRETSPRPDSPR